MSRIADFFNAMPENVRLGVIGGAGGSLVAPGGPRVMDEIETPKHHRERFTVGY